MKINALFLTILLTSSIFTNKSSAQPNASVDEAKIKEFFNEEKIDATKIKDLSTEQKAALTATIKADPEFLKSALETTASQTNQSLQNPEIAVKAAEVQQKLVARITSVNQLDQTILSVDKSVALQANFPSVNTTGTLNSKVFAVQYVAYEEFPEDTGIYWGYGLYMTIDLSSADASMTANLPVLAANATVSNRSFNFKSKLVGFEGPDLHKLMDLAMPGSSFNVETFAGFEQFKKALTAGVTAGTIKIKAVKIRPVDELEKLDSDRIAAARMHALINIARRINLKNALEAFPEKSTESIAVIKSVYRSHITNDVNARPNPEQSARAKLFVTQAGITNI